MKSFFFLLCTSVTLSLTSFFPLSGLAQTTLPSKRYVIIGYVSGSGWTKAQIDARKLTHINYAFAVPDQSCELAPISAKDKANLAELTSLRAVNKDLKILISVEAGAAVSTFLIAALTEASRRRFAESAVGFLKEHKLDGVDIDWEYPAQIGAGNIFRPEDKENFTLFLKAIRDRLDEQGKLDKRTGTNHYLLQLPPGATRPL